VTYQFPGVVFYNHQDPSDALLDSWIDEPRKLQSIVALNGNYINVLERSIQLSIASLKSDLGGQKRRDEERIHYHKLLDRKRITVRTQTLLKNTLKRIYRDRMLVTHN
jgi:hypothetical protein